MADIPLMSNEQIMSLRQWAGSPSYFDKTAFARAIESARDAQWRERIQAQDARYAELKTLADIAERSADRARETVARRDERIQALEAERSMLHKVAAQTAADLSRLHTELLAMTAERDAALAAHPRRG